MQIKRTGGRPLVQNLSIIPSNITVIRIAAPWSHLAQLLLIAAPWSTSFVAVWVDCGRDSHKSRQNHSEKSGNNYANGGSSNFSPRLLPANKLNN
jgi:hypothetical protein